MNAPNGLHGFTTPEVSKTTQNKSKTPLKLCLFLDHGFDTFLITFWSQKVIKKRTKIETKTKQKIGVLFGVSWGVSCGLGEDQGDDIRGGGVPGEG